MGSTAILPYKSEWIWIWFGLRAGPDVAILTVELAANDDARQTPRFAGPASGSGTVNRSGEGSTGRCAP